MSDDFELKPDADPPPKAAVPDTVAPSQPAPAAAIPAAPPPVSDSPSLETAGAVAEESAAAPPAKRGSFGAYVALAREHSLKLLLLGTALTILAFALSWWSVTKYRVKPYRGVDLTNSSAVSDVRNKLESDERNELDDEIKAYDGAWMANTNLHADFYREVDEKYNENLTKQDAVSKNTASISLRGWSTWTGWFGVIFVVIGIAAYVVPKFVEPLESWAWAVPWLWVLAAGIYFLLAISFYFSVPDQNGDGYSQGNSLGVYVAILAGLAVMIGGVFEGLKAADERLARLENEPATDDEDEEEEEEEEETRPLKSKGKIVEQKPLDEEAERRRRLNDW